MNKFTVFLFSLLSASSSFAAEEIVELSLPSMNCAVCPITVKKALEKVQGVHFVEVSYKTKLALVKFENTVTSSEALILATTDAGFPSALKLESIHD